MLERIKRRLTEIDKLPENSNLDYWRGQAIFARIALVLADHSVSAEIHYDQNAPAYANTDRATGSLNQDLNKHLEKVGDSAGDMVFRMLSLAPPSLSNQAIDNICAPSGGRFRWQDTASAALSESAARVDQPHLVFNMACTGSGKTRMNLRAICELARGSEVRVATALNLRTLTLQTGDTYAEQLGIGRDELTCVIGDRLTKTLHLANKQQASTRLTENEDEDGNPQQDDLESIGEFEYSDAPEWLRKFTSKKPKTGSIIGAPVLVSTIDFLIAAGEPIRQGHHALAALRLMTSDLILDEIDGYDTTPLMAVLRIVMMSAFFGRNVIVSSGTLSRPVAAAVWRAYARGADMRGALNDAVPAFVTAAIDDCTAPVLSKIVKQEEFDAFYDKRVDKMMNALAASTPYRIPMLQRIATKNRKGFFAAICESVSILHNLNHLVDSASEKRISFGLVRIANINSAVMVADHLSSALPHARIACYHSQHMPLARFHIERRLDQLLRRNNGDKHLFSDSEIRDVIDASPVDDIVFIVVATPVEEIGRDHDFDWALIEPSSSQSIVQTAGRVNRHRLIEVRQPNVAILQFNWREIEKKSPAFTKPGLETTEEDGVYGTHDLAELIDWEKFDAVDARLRFLSHRFACYDDRNINAALEPWIGRQFGDAKKNGHLWMCADLYKKTPLRDHQIKLEITLTDISNPRVMMVKSSDDWRDPIGRVFTIDGAINNAWLYLDDSNLCALAIESGVSIEDGLTATVTGTMESDLEGLRRNLAFGFYRIELPLPMQR